MTNQNDLDETIQRVATAAIAYYPDVAVDDPAFSLEEEANWCLEPLGELRDAQLSTLRDVIARAIVDPTAHRQDVFAVLLEVRPG